MDYLSKSIVVTVFFSLVTMSFTTSADVYLVSNDAKNLTECRSLVNAEVGDVERMKVVNIKSKARSFTVKFKVKYEGESSTLQCRLTRDEVASISCLKGSICNDGVVLSKRK